MSERHYNASQHRTGGYMIVACSSGEPVLILMGGNNG